MIGPTNARGGGGGLNLKVVGGTTQPANKRENTIWVNTTTTITGYALSPTQPETGTEGLVWLKTADTGVEINVGRKNAVLLHLADGKLYTGGAWANIEGWVYAGASWTQFAWARLYLFKDGVDNTELTGGWTNNGWKYNSSPVGTVSIADGQINFNPVSDGYRGGGTGNAINLNGFKSLSAVMTYSNTSSFAYFGISKSKNSSPKYWVAGIQKSGAENDFTVSIDLNNPGSCYIGFGRVESVREVYIE